MTRDEVYRALPSLFEDVFDRTDLVITPALSAADVAGWDSLKQVELIVAVQQAFHVRFTTREADGMANVGELVDAILAKGGRVG